jgi:hypothetical protein
LKQVKEAIAQKNTLDKQLLLLIRRRKALELWLKSHHELVFSNREILKLAIFKQSGHPKLNQQLDKYEYQISG